MEEAMNADRISAGKPPGKQLLKDQEGDGRILLRLTLGRYVVWM
jgi:hypothetical protein